MTDFDLKKQFARNKLEKAWEAWDEAKWAFKGGKYPSAVNRIYYAFYRACLALLAFHQEKIPTKHAAVIGEVNRVYVKNGVLPREIGRFLHRLQVVRTEADYRDKEFSQEEVQKYIELGKKYLQQIEELVYKLASESPQK